MSRSGVIGVELIEKEAPNLCVVEGDKVLSSSDISLIEQWTASRDAFAFKEIASRHSAMVYATSNRLLRNPADAEEVTQECFLKLAQGQMKNAVSLPGWLHTVAVRLSLNRIRSQKRRRDRELRYAAENRQTMETQWDDIMSHIDEAITDLPETLRYPVIQHFLEGQSQESIAQELGVSRWTVSRRLKKGIEQIRKFVSRRGIVTTTSSLGCALGATMADATPPALAASIGKLALTGATTHMAAPAIQAVSQTSNLITLGGILMGTKKVVFLVATLAIVAGGFSLSRKLNDTVASHDTPRQELSQGTSAIARSGDVKVPNETVFAEKSNAINDTSYMIATSEKKPEGDTLSNAPDGSFVIHGIVVDANGEPVADAEVILQSNELGVNAPIITDAKGHFEIFGLDSNVYTLSVSKPGEGFGIVNGIRSGTDIVLITLQPSGTISGRVYDHETDDGIPGISILTVPSKRDDSNEAFMAHLYSRQQQTGSDGTYRMEVPAPAEYRIILRNTGDYEPPNFRVERLVEVEIYKEHENEDFALMKGGSITGYILDAQDKGLAGVQVDIIDKHSGSNAPRGQTISGDDGAYSFRGLLRSATYAVRASCEGLASTESDPITLQGSENVHDINIYLCKGKTVSGHVITSSGISAPGLAIALLSGDKNDYAPIPFLNDVTANDGSFAIINVAPGEYRTSVTTGMNSGGIATKIQGHVFSVPTDDGIHDLIVEIGLEIEGFITGRLTDTRGNPLSNTSVGAHSRNVHAWSRTDKDGIYRIEGLGSSDIWVMQIFEGDGFKEEKRFNVSVNSEGIDFVRSKPTTIKGKVVDDTTGKPITRFEIKAGIIWTEFASPTGEFMVTDDDDNESVITLEARAKGYAITKTDATISYLGETIEGIIISLIPGEAVKGIVLDAITDQPIQGVRVKCFEGLINSEGFEKGYAWSAGDPVTDSEGRFQLTGVEPGIPANIIAWAPGYAPCVMLNSMDAEVNFFMEIGGTITGVAYDGSQVVANMEIEIRHIAEEGLFDYRTEANTDTTGEFSVTNLPPGDYVVSYGEDDQQDRITIIENETVELEIQTN